MTKIHYKSKLGIIKTYSEWKDEAIEFYKYCGMITPKYNTMPADWWRRWRKILEIKKTEERYKVIKLGELDD